MLKGLRNILAVGVFMMLAFPAIAFASDGEKFEFKINGDEFEVEGIVTEVSNDTIEGPSHDVFMVNGISVMIDPSMVEEFRQEGDLAVGAEVEAKGTVIDGVNFAERVEVEEPEEEEPDED